MLCPRNLAGFIFLECDLATPVSDVALYFQITFNNRAHSGKIKVYFDSDTDIQECKDWHIFNSGKYGACVSAEQQLWVSLCFPWSVAVCPARHSQPVYPPACKTINLPNAIRYLLLIKS